jgi:hypothetical protein
LFARCQLGVLVLSRCCRLIVDLLRSTRIVSFCSEIFLFCFTATVLTFLIAGLLYLLCFEHVDNLGAYSIQSETGLLIPSDFVNRCDNFREAMSNTTETEQLNAVQCLSLRELSEPRDNSLRITSLT